MENQKQEIQLTLEQQLQQAKEQLDQTRKERIAYCEEKQIDEAIQVLCGFDNHSISEEIYLRVVELTLPNGRIIQVGGQFSPRTENASWTAAFWKNQDEEKFADENCLYWRGDEYITVFHPGSWWIDTLLQRADEEKKAQQERKTKAELEKVLQQLKAWESLEDEPEIKSETDTPAL